MTIPGEITARVAAFAAGTGAGDVPAACRERAALHLFDTLGVTLAGSLEEQSRIAARTALATAGSGNCSILGTAARVSPTGAALANGTSGHALDFDDVQHPWYGHPSVVLFPALFALAEMRGLGGAAVATAYAVGLSVGDAFARAMNVEHYARGWHATSTFGTVASGAACANLLGLGREASRNAVGIAASGACGLRQNFGTMTKPLHAGLAASHGVLAALLAEQGFTASDESLDGPLGFGPVFSGGKFDTAALVAALDAGIGAGFHNLAIKQYPSCAATHCVLDAVTGLVADGTVRSADEVVSAACEVSPLAPNLLIYDRPTTGLEGKFSLEYCVAVALLDGGAGLAQFTDERARDPVLQALIRRVSKRPDPTVDPHGDFGTRITLTLRDGRKVTRHVEQARGKPGGEPIGKAEVERKFRACAATALREEVVGEVAATFLELDSLEDVRIAADRIRAGLREMPAP